MKDLLTGKVVLVSGGTQGLGAGIARAAAREGATLVLTGRNAEHGEKVAAELQTAGATPSSCTPTSPTSPRPRPRSRRPSSGTAGSTAWSTRPD